MKLSERIKKYRLDNNMTQQELADKLYVSKQAVSKWENERSLPDVSLYPVIAEMLNISVDELMGTNVTKKRKVNIKKLIIISSMSLFIILLLIIINPIKLVEKAKLVNETEQALDIKLPTIETYQLVEYSKWLSFNNYMYPRQMYYFVFKDEIIVTDNTWLDTLPQELIDEIPVGSSEYPYICDYYKLVDLTSNNINKISDELNHKYILYCLQITNKRLIAIKFEV